MRLCETPVARVATAPISLGEDAEAATDRRLVAMMTGHAIEAGARRDRG